MVDLSETPAVPPEDHGGDERAGFLVAGGLLIAVGWGLAVVLNVLAHAMAPRGGSAWGPVTVFPTMGPFAWAAFGLGLFTGAIGVGLLLLARSSPKGRFVLPGFAY